MKNKSKSAGLLVAIASLSCAGLANANSLTAVIGGSAQSGATYVTFDSLAGGSTANYTSGGLTVSFAGNAQTESATVNNSSSAPYLSGNNNLHFGSIYTGADTTTYLSAGNGNGSITFNFSSVQNYLGLLWGSIDFGTGNGLNNFLTFYSGANGTGSVVDAVDGNALVAANTSLDDNLSDNGSVDSTGTAYVNINSTLGFQSVVATSGWFTFEMDNIAYAGSVPDGGTTLVLLGASLACLWGFKRKTTLGNA